MGKHSSSFRLHGQTPLLLALVLCCLSLPAIIGWERNNASAARELENRNLAAAPPFKLLRKNPPEYIKSMDAYLKDTVGFRLEANALYRKLRYYIFQDPPLANVTIGRDGHSFLNSPQATQPYAFFESLCMQQGTPSGELLAQLDQAMAAASGFFERRGARAYFAIAPSTLSLYADKLPLQVAPAYRKACMAYPSQDHALAKLQRQGEATHRYHIFYPYDLFAGHKNEKGFYPKERYHWEGKSTYLFARHLSHFIGATDTVVDNDQARLSTVKDDIAGFFGFSRTIAGYEYHSPAKVIQVEAEKWLKAFSEHGVMVRINTANSLSPKSALLIANSFGIALAPQLAKSFKDFYYLDLNMIREDEQAAVFAAIAERLQPDYVFFVFDDVNVTTIPRRLAGFAQLNEQVNQAEVLPSKGSGLEKSGQ